MLVELGTDGNAAIRKVRDARSRNAIENWWQEDYLRRCESLDSISASEAEEDIRDRAIGTFLGLAVGDALGTTLEFHARDAQPRLLDITGSGYFNSPTCYWTDDTAMARVLADNLVASGGLDCRDLMDRFVAWWRSGQYSCTGRCCGLGRTTRRALERYRRTQDPLAGSTDPMTAGNGSLMRLAPVALRFWNDRAQLGIAAAQQSRTTHAASEAVDACRAFADVIADAVSD